MFSLICFGYDLQRKLLDVSLGFAAGVMTAASYWSLLDPAIQLCEKQGIYGRFAFLPVALGFLLGAVFVFGTDVFLDYLGLNSTNMMMCKYSLLFIVIFDLTVFQLHRYACTRL